jgi:hypothetical protein
MMRENRLLFFRVKSQVKVIASKSNETLCRQDRDETTI